MPYYRWVTDYIAVIGGRYASSLIDGWRQRAVGASTGRTSLWACQRISVIVQPAMTAVSFRMCRRHFGAVRAVDGVDLDIAPGEFFAMLGPSGSGKTTCLRLIAGFEQPTAGRIEIFGETRRGRAALPPQRQHRVPGLRAVPAHERAATTSPTG